jgi:hypothetical protein
MSLATPDWAIPENISDISDIVDTGDMWEDDSWAPFLFTVMGGTVYKRRPIPLSWQIEFAPADDAFAGANEAIAALGVDPDGYGWANVLRSVIAKHHPDIVDELQFGDTEAATCVVWVESESSCKTLMQVAWGLNAGK